MNIDIKDIKVKIKLLSSDKILAQATLILFDVWEEHSWKVLKSNQPHKIFGEYIWIQAPSYKNGMIWKEIIFINDEPLYREVERLIFEAYQRTKNKDEALSGINEKLTDDDYKKIDEIQI